MPRRRRPTATQPRPQEGNKWDVLLAGLWGLLAVLFLVFFFSHTLSLGTRNLGRTELWLFLVLPDQIAAQWFGEASVVEALADRGPLLLVVSAILASALACGWLALRAAKLTVQLNGLEQFVFSAGLGLQAVSLYTLAVGWAGWLLPAVFLVPICLVVALAGVLLASDLRSRKRNRQNQGRPDPQKQGDHDSNQPSSSRKQPTVQQSEWPVLFSAGWLILVVPFLTIMMLSGMIPPEAFDVREYHLQAPKEFFQNGFVGFLPHNVYANMPLGAQIPTLMAISLVGDWPTGVLAGKAITALFGPLGVLAVLATGQRLANWSVGILAAVLYASLPWLYHVSSTGYIEGASAFFLCTTFLAGQFSRMSSGNLPSQTSQQDFPAGPLTWAALAGFLAGAAFSCKYPNLVFVVAPAAVVVAWPQWGRFGRFCWKKLGVFLLACGGSSGLWLVKNAVLTGNPVYPLLGSVFGVGDWTSHQIARWDAAHSHQGYSLAELAASTWSLTIGSNFLSPLILPLLALVFVLFRRWPGWLWAAVLWLFSGLALWWTLTHRIDRFWVPLLPLAAIVAAAAAHRSEHRIWRWVVSGFLLVGLSWNLLADLTIAGLHPHYRYFAGFQELWNDPQRLNPFHKKINKDLLLAQPASGQAGRLLVLCVGEAAVLDFRQPVLYSTVFDGCPLVDIVQDPASKSPGRLRDPQAIREEFQKRRIGWVYVNWDEIERYKKPGSYGFSPLITQELFLRLVEDGVLWPALPPPPEEELAPIPEQPQWTADSGAIYRVR